jgi:hypothetical protein
MTTWQQFREDKEKDEEKNGLDQDKDDEKGEDKKHKAAVKAAKAENIAFFEARRDGARKIANEANSKGTEAAKLTYWHFKHKDLPYAEVIRAIKSDQNETFFASKYRQALNRIRMHMKQEEFQRFVGEMEVFGEAFSKLFE